METITTLYAQNLQHEVLSLGCSREFTPNWHPNQERHDLQHHNSKIGNRHPLHVPTPRPTSTVVGDKTWQSTDSDCQVANVFVLVAIHSCGPCPSFSPLQNPSNAHPSKWMDCPYEASEYANTTQNCSRVSCFLSEFSNHHPSSAWTRHFVHCRLGRYIWVLTSCFPLFRGIHFFALVIFDPPC